MLPADVRRGVVLEGFGHVDVDEARIIRGTGNSSHVLSAYLGHAFVRVPTTVPLGTKLPDESSDNLQSAYGNAL
jgi:hypothetical protein